MSDEINGIKIQRLPTYGKPLSYKSSKWRSTQLIHSKSKEEIKRLQKIKQILSEKDKK